MPCAVRLDNEALEWVNQIDGRVYRYANYNWHRTADGCKRLYFYVKQRDLEGLGELMNEIYTLQWNAKKAGHAVVVRPWPESGIMEIDVEFFHKESYHKPW